MALVKTNTADSINLRQILNQLGERSFGFLLVIVTIISFIPLISVITGVIFCIIGVQMMLGIKKIQLPKFILDRHISSVKINKAFQIVAPKIQYLETYIRPRWHLFNSNLVTRVNGLMIVLLGIINGIPLPLTNIAPAVLIMILGIGLIEKDGLVQFIALLSCLMFALLMGFLLLF